MAACPFYCGGDTLRNWVTRLYFAKLQWRIGFLWKALINDYGNHHFFSLLFSFTYWKLWFYCAVFYLTYNLWLGCWCKCHGNWQSWIGNRISFFIQLFFDLCFWLWMGTFFQGFPEYNLIDVLHGTIFFDEPSRFIFWITLEWSITLSNSSHLSMGQVYSWYLDTGFGERKIWISFLQVWQTKLMGNSYDYNSK